jgi:putative membrane protein
LVLKAEDFMHGLNLHLKRVSWIAFIAGLTVFVLLIGYYGIGDIAAALAVAGASGLALIAAVHILPLAAEAMGWRFLFAPDKRPGFRTLLWGRWIGEAVDNLLPVASLGGDLVRIRLFTKLGMSGSVVAASLVTDLTLTLVTLISFTLLGLVLLAFYVVPDGVLLPVLLAVLIGIVLVIGFYVAQQRGLFGALARLVQNFAGPLDARVLEGADAIDVEARRVYTRREDVISSIFWLAAAWLLGVLEVWIALWLLGYPLNFFEAFLIESLVQGVRAAAFLIPGALGAQEGGFLLVGTLLSLPAEGALALALTRRARELAFGIPGILAWQWFEARALAPSALGSVGSCQRESQRLRD